MKLSVETKVGIFTTVGLIALAWIIIYYGGYKFGEDKGYTFTVLFQRVDGLKRGADIQVAGVRVGQIMNVNFDKDQTVRVTVKVESLSVDIDRESTFIIDSGIVGEKWLSVRPKSTKPEGFIKKDGKDVLYGETPVNLQDLTKDVKHGISQLTGTIKTIDVTAKNVNKIVGDKETQKALKDTVLNVRQASEELNRLLVSTGGHIDTISAEVQSTLRLLSSELEMTTADVRDNLDMVSGDVYRFTNTLNRIAGDNETDVRDMVRNLKKTSQELEVAIEYVNTFVGDQDISNDIRETLKSLRRTSATVEETATNLQAFVTDKELQQDLRDTISNARSTLENADALLAGTREFFAKRDTLIPSKVSYQLLLTGERNENGDVDGSADVLANLYNKSGDAYLQIGITDVNDESRMNVQLGKILNERNTVRVGVIKANFGFGYDYRFSENATVNLDFFDIAHPTLDFKTRYKLNDRVDLILGVDNIFRDEQQVKLGTGINF